MSDKIREIQKRAWPQEGSELRHYLHDDADTDVEIWFAIAIGVDRYDNAILIDWSSATSERTDLLAGDGFHPSGAGRVVLADLIAEAIIPGWESKAS